MGLGELGPGPHGEGARVRGPEWHSHLCGRGEGKGHLSRARGGGRGGGGLGVGAGLAHQATQAGAAEQRSGQHGGSRWTAVAGFLPSAGGLEGEEDDARVCLGERFQTRTHARTATHGGSGARRAGGCSSSGPSAQSAGLVEGRLDDSAWGRPEAFAEETVWLNSGFEGRPLRARDWRDIREISGFRLWCGMVWAFYRHST